MADSHLARLPKNPDTYGVKVDRRKTCVTPTENVAWAVAMELASVPSRGVDVTVWDPVFSLSRVKVTRAPGGMLLAAITISTGPGLLMARSGAVKLPVGSVGTATPATLTTRTDGPGPIPVVKMMVEGNRVAIERTDPAAGTSVLPVRVNASDSMRMRPVPPTNH